MLDDINVLKQHDSLKDLEFASFECEQVKFEIAINNGDHDNRSITNIILVGMGGSALAGALAKSWLRPELKVPFEVVKTYGLPASVDQNTLVIVSSYSGNTEESVDFYRKAREKGAQIAIIASGGELLSQADENQIVNVALPTGHQPRMVMVATLRAIIAVLEHFNIMPSGKLDEIASSYDWIKSECNKWGGDVSVVDNYAKQLALQAVGKTAVFFSGTFAYPAAYKWKTCFNETAKNLSFLCEFPEFNHNEMLGWTSHPVEKPFAIFDIISNLEHPQILKRIDISDRLLSGKRPKAITINLAGDSAFKQLLWGCILADFVSIYLAVLNGIDPMEVRLIESLKMDLVA